MGRHVKTVSDASTGIDRRESGYYSTPSFIAQYLAREALRILPSARSAFDPCTGRDELLKPFPNTLSLHSMDILDLPGRERLSSFRHMDFLRWFADRSDGAMFLAAPEPHDIFVANPPYNCHEVDYVRSNRDWLKRTFPEVGIDNTYSMFVSALIDIAKPGAVIALVLLDSLLIGRSHAALRRKILSNCAIHSLLLCPNDLFRSQNADVRTCILILQKGIAHQGDVLTCDRPATTDELKTILAQRLFSSTALEDVVLTSRRDNSEFVVGIPNNVLQFLGTNRLEDEFDCLTGVSTGNDSHYISKTVQGRHSVPFFKNPASRRFYMEPDGFLPTDFLDICEEVPNFMVRNREYLWKEGISCSSMGARFGACYLPAEALFGVNANVFSRRPSSGDLWWLLAYLNSSFATFMVRKVIA